MTGMMDCIHLALVRTSIISLSSNYLPAIVARAVEVKLAGWTAERVFSVALQIPYTQKRCEVLTLLLDLEQRESSIRLESDLRQQIADQALQAALAIDDELSRASALSGLAGVLQGEQVERALQAALAIDDVRYRASALSGLAGVLQGEQVERALQAILGLFEIGLSSDRKLILSIISLPNLITPQMLGLGRDEFSKIADSVIAVTTQWRWL